MVLHVFAQSGDEIKPVFKEQLGQESGNIPPISKELVTQSFDHPSNRSAVINIAWNQTAGKPLASIIDRQMQFKNVFLLEADRPPITFRDLGIPVH